MKFAAAIVSLAVASCLPTTSAFAPPKGAQIVTGLSAQYGPQDGPIAADCLCCDPLVTPRGARVATPLATLLGANIVLPEAAFAAKKPFECAVQKYFPKAMPSSEVEKLVKSELKTRGYDVKNTLFGTSVCPDEINTKPGASLASTLQKALSKQNGIFSLGGLAGLPFAGVSGMKAFLSHAPSKGKVVIFFGPHVGVSKEGVVGKVERLGLKKVSTSCGAAIGAYKAIISGADDPNNGTRDYQEDYIIANLRPKLAKADGVKEDAMPAFVTKSTYYLVLDMLMDELNTVWSGDKFWDNISEVTLVGGILINRGQEIEAKKEEDYFQPLVFESWTKACGCGPPAESTDLFEQAFGFESSA